MKVDTSRIDRQTLTAAINEAYDLEITSLRFLPKGEDAYNYLGEGANGWRCFVKAQETAMPWELETAMMATAALRDEASLPWIVAADPTRSGRFVVDFAGYKVSVFQFVPGIEAFELPLPAECWRSFGAIVAQLHQALPNLATGRGKRSSRSCASFDAAK